jgi:hypothetical protein
MAYASNNLFVAASGGNSLKLLSLDYCSQVHAWFASQKSCSDNDCPGECISVHIVAAGIMLFLEALSLIAGIYAYKREM